MHKVLATASGAAGGAFGLAALPIELPVSTIIMLRAIGEIARSEGEDPSDPEAALSCIQVFALGGRAGSSDASESGYFAVRGMLHLIGHDRPPQTRPLLSSAENDLP